MLELKRFPESDTPEVVAKEAPHIKRQPYVKFKKVYAHHIDGQVELKEELCFMPILHSPNEEALGNLRNEGCEFIGYGNFPSDRKDLAAIIQWLTKNSNMLLEDTTSPEFQAMKAKILAAEEAPAAKVKEKKAAKDEKQSEIIPPVGL